MVSTDVFMRIEIDDKNYTRKMYPKVIPSAGIEIDLMVDLLEQITRTTVWLLAEMDNSGLIITWTKCSEDVRIGTTWSTGGEMITHLVTPVGTFNMLFELSDGLRASGVYMNDYVRDALQLIECEVEKEDPLKLSFEQYQEYLATMLLCGDDWDENDGIREYVSVAHANALRDHRKKHQNEIII